MDQKNTFILGLGCQKCGTNWVYNYMRSSGMLNIGAGKEVNIWDALDVPDYNYQRVPPFRNSVEIRKDMRNGYRYIMQNEPEFYFDYFAAHFSDGKFLATDLTPNYNALKADRINYIKENFSARNIDVKAVIIIRDPVSRVKSAVRFNLDNNYGYNEGVELGVTDFKTALKQYYNKPWCNLRTRYNSILEEAPKVFDAEHLYIGVYENMFTNSEIARLSDFLGLPARPEMADVIVNKTAGAVEDSDLDTQIREYYDDVYAYCFDRIPVTKALWRA